VRSRRVSSTHAWIGRWSRRPEISSSGEVDEGWGVGGRSFDTGGSFLLCLPSGRFSGRCRLWLGLLRPSRFPGGGHCRLGGRLRDRLRRRFRIRWWSGCGLDNTPPSDDVVPALAQILLLSRWPGPLCFRSCGLARGVALSDTLWRSLCKGRPRFFPLYASPVIRCVVAPAATALRLLPGC
jgi:hypothetical protein